MEYLSLGKIIKPHGLKGEVKVFSTTDFASLRYKKGNVVFYFTNDSYIPLEVTSFKKGNDYDIVSFKDYDNIDKTKELIGKELFIKKIDASLPNNYYHYIDLVNCEIISNNKSIGIVKEVIKYPANYIIRCKNKDKSFDIPFVDAFIKNVDIKNKRITVELIEGIL